MQINCTETPERNFYMDMNVTTLEPMYIVGITMRTDNTRAHEDIPAHWGKWIEGAWNAKIKNTVDNEIVAVYYDYDSDYTGPYSFVLGRRVASLDAVPEGAVALTIPSGTYGKVVAQGPMPAGLVKTWQQIWQDDADTPRAYTYDFEIYPADGTMPDQIPVLLALKNEPK